MLKHTNRKSKGRQGFQGQAVPSAHFRPLLTSGPLMSQRFTKTAQHPPRNTPGTVPPAPDGETRFLVGSNPLETPAVEQSAQALIHPAESDIEHLYGTNEGLIVCENQPEDGENLSNEAAAEGVEDQHSPHHENAQNGDLEHQDVPAWLLSRLERQEARISRLLLDTARLQKRVGIAEQELHGIKGSL